MAKRKRAKPSARRRRSAVTVTRKRRRRSSMGSGLNMAGLKGAGLNTVKGLVGGLVYRVAEKWLNTAEPNARLFMGIGLSALTSLIVKQPAIGAGIAGAIVQGQAFRIPGLADGTETVTFVRPDTLLNEGREYFLSENGTRVFPLADGSFSTVYPGYLNPGMYDGRMGARSLVNVRRESRFR